MNQVKNIAFWGSLIAVPSTLVFVGVYLDFIAKDTALSILALTNILASMAFNTIHTIAEE